MKENIFKKMMILSKKLEIYFANIIFLNKFEDNILNKYIINNWKNEI